MIGGCQNTSEKLILENEISTIISKEDKSVSNNKKFFKDQKFKSEVILNREESIIKQKHNDVIFEFRNERLLQGRDNFTPNNKTKKALSAVFKMLKQNLNSDNDNLKLNHNSEISLVNRHFDINKDTYIYNNILAFLPLTGPYSNYGIKTRKAL